MSEKEKLEERRKRILNEMREIRAMRKGSVTQQLLKVTHKGKKQPVMRGPYWLYTRKEKGKTVGKRLPPEITERYREEVEAYHRFQILCSKFAECTERLGDLEWDSEDHSREKKR